MAFGLLRAVLESHAFGGPPQEPVDGTLRLQVDQVLLDAEQAPLVVALLERADRESVRVQPAVADSGRGASAGDTASLPDWQRSALRMGVLLPRPGWGETETLHRRSLATPGGMLLCTGRLAASGASGMLALRADALEAAAVLAGGPLVLRVPRVLGVEVIGTPVAGACGVDLALALLSRLPELGGAVDVVEIGGAGGLGMGDREAVAWLMAEGGLSCLFPSDDRTRAQMEGAGRGREWRSLEAAVPGRGAVWSVRLGDLEPLVAPLEDLAGARALRAFEGTEIQRVMLGPGATFTDVATFARVLAGRRVHGGVDCTVVAGSRGLFEEAGAAGLVEGLLSAGVRVAEGEVSAHAAGTGTGLCVGVPGAAVASGRTRWLVARADCCAVAALEGVIARPVRDDGGMVHAGGGASAATADPWLRGEAGTGPARAAPARGTNADGMTTPRGSYGGEVLAVLGDGVDSAGLLPPGARLESLRGTLRALAGQALAGTWPRFGALAGERGGGVLVAGSDFAGGGPLAAAAICLSELWVRTVLARSFAAGATPSFVHAGVLPLVLDEDGARGGLECGDELELPGVPEALAPGHPVAVRNLTRGTRFTLAHELSEREISILRAGGLLPHVLGGPQPAGRS